MNTNRWLFKSNLVSWNVVKFFDNLKNFPVWFVMKKCWFFFEFNIFVQCYVFHYSGSSIRCTHRKHQRTWGYFFSIIFLLHIPLSCLPLVKISLSFSIILINNLLLYFHNWKSFMIAVCYSCHFTTKTPISSQIRNSRQIQTEHF